MKLFPSIATYTQGSFLEFSQLDDNDEYLRKHNKTSVQTANISALSSRLRLKFINKSFKVTDEKEKTGVVKWVHPYKRFFPSSFIHLTQPRQEMFYYHEWVILDFNFVHFLSIFVSPETSCHFITKLACLSQQYSDQNAIIHRSGKGIQTIDNNFEVCHET